MGRARGRGEKRAEVSSGAGITPKPGRSRLGRDQHLRKSKPQPARRPARSLLRAEPARVRCLPRRPPPPRSLASWEPLAGRDPSSSCRAAAAAATATPAAAAARAARRWGRRRRPRGAEDLGNLPFHPRWTASLREPGALAADAPVPNWFLAPSS